MAKPKPKHRALARIRRWLARYWIPALHARIRELEARDAARKIAADLRRPTPVYLSPEDPLGPGTLARVYWGHAMIGGRVTNCLRLAAEQDGTVYQRIADAQFKWGGDDPA